MKHSPLFSIALSAFLLGCATATCSAQNAEDTALEIDLSPKTIAGVVVDEQGKPIESVQVEARTPVVGFHSSFSMPTGGDPFKPRRLATTDRDGRFRITDVPLHGQNEVQLSLRAKHRHVNDNNYPVSEDIRIEMSGSGLPGVVQASLIDLATRQPITSDVEARIVRRYVPQPYEITLHDGRFVLPAELTLGNEYMVYLYVKGYAAMAAKLKAVAPELDEYQEVILVPRRPLVGRLVDAQTGEPIAGAAIMNGRADDAWYFSWGEFEKYVDGYHQLTYVQQTTTDDDGEFWFAETNGATLGTLFVLADGYARFVLPPELRPMDPRTGEIIVPVPQESVFAGIVLRDGKPLANENVSVRSPYTRRTMEQWYPHPRTDAEGRYRLGGLPAGDYIMFAGSYGRRATAIEAETVEVNFGADLGPLRIWGKAPAGASIYINPKFDWHYTSLQTTADDKGQYEFQGLRLGRYTASVSARGSGGFRGDHYRVPEFEVTSDGQQVDLLNVPKQNAN